ncbi:MAG: hypothetical protein ACK5MT_18140 [Actinomycetales bacterium]
MALGDITSRDAVLDAIDDYEDLGHLEFMQGYGAGLVGELTIEYIGRRYPARAVLNRAHEKLTGSALAVEDLPEVAAVRCLEQLGFRVSGLSAPAPTARATRSSSRSSTTAKRSPAKRSQPSGTPRATIVGVEWTLEPGELHPRDTFKRFGISRNALIEASVRARSLFLFISPFAAGDARTGLDFRRDGAAYLVVGDGRRGNQQWNAANTALLKHAENGHVVRLLEENDEPWRPGGRRFWYRGAFALDPEQPWQAEHRADAEGRDRTVIVFRLLPTDGAHADPGAETDPDGAEATPSQQAGGQSEAGSRASG